MHTLSWLTPAEPGSDSCFLPVFAALLVATSGWSQEKTTIKKTPIPQSNSTSGKQMFADYCAPCRRCTQPKATARLHRR